MRLYRRTYKGPDGKLRTGRSWIVQYYLGGRRYYRSLGTRDRRAAELKAADMVRRHELREAGVLDPFEEHRNRPLADHLRDFEKSFRGRDVVARYVVDRLGCLNAFVKATGVKRVSEMNLPDASAWLGDLKATGLSARTVNRHYQALRQFGRWLVTVRRIDFDPFTGLEPLNEAADRRRVRRALTPEEAVRLIEAARTRPLLQAKAERVRKGVTPPERARLMRIGELRVLLYALAIGTGLRRGELRRLRWCDLDLQNGLLTVPAASAKSRREQAVDLHPRLVEALKSARREDTDPLATVIPGDCHPTTRTFHMDLVAAGIAKEQRISLEPNPKGHTFKRRFDTRDATGRVIDFHALRTTFISWLNMTGAHPRTAQALARHANIETTMARYTDIRLVDLRAAVERLPLPALPPPSPPESVPLPVPLSTVTEPHSGAQPSTGGTEASSS